MKSTATPEHRKSGTIYDILKRIGIKYIGTQLDLPKFPKEAVLAERFYWETQDIYQEYQQERLSRDEAMAKTIEKTNEYGPLIWGPDRSNIVEDYSEFPRQLYWEDSKDEDFIVSQAIQLFEYRVSKGSTKPVIGEKRKLEDVNAEGSKRTKKVGSAISGKDGKAVESSSPRTPRKRGVPSDIKDIDVRSSPKMAKKTSNTPTRTGKSGVLAALISTASASVPAACDNCIRQNLRCDRTKPPCFKCTECKIICTYDGPLKTPKTAKSANNSSASEHMPPLQVSKSSSSSSKSRDEADAHEKGVDKADEMANTLLFFRLQGKENKFPPMKLGICLSINDFFAKIAWHIQEPVQSILQLAIRLPVDIGRLDEYVLQIGVGQQSEFEKLVRILSDADVELDSGAVPVRYILTATIAVK